MSKHSEQKLPRLYKEAGKIVQKVKEEGGSVKTLVYGSRHRKIKALYALVLETLKHHQQLDHLVRKTQILLKHPKLNPWVTRVLMTELIWQKKTMTVVSPPQEIVQSFHEQFLSELANTPKDASNSSKPAQQFRYVRVNTLKGTTENVVEWFENVGWQEVTSNTRSKISSYKVQSLDDDQFMRDSDIPDLLKFPHNFKFYETELYEHGVILLQDKASCVPPLVLDPPPSSVVLDMCAAPGMKTSHVAAIVGKKGKVYAVEINKRRYETLCQTVEKSGATCVQTINGDVLHHSSQNLRDVEYVILDPPCSGSGMLSRKSIFGETENKEADRLAKLASFQCNLLRHAMTNFPNVKRIVYSTCSIYPEENEAVVESVLRSVAPNFTPVRNPPFTNWMTRGSSEYKFGSYGFYAHPSTHFTNGFFVILFERSENEYVSSSKPLMNDVSLVEEGVLSVDEPKKKKKKKKAVKDAEKGEKNPKSTPTDNVMEKMLMAMQKMKESVVQENSDKEDDSKNCKIKKKSKTSSDNCDNDCESVNPKKKKKKSKSRDIDNSETLFNDDMERANKKAKYI